MTCDQKYITTFSVLVLLATPGLVRAQSSIPELGGAISRVDFGNCESTGTDNSLGSAVLGSVFLFDMDRFRLSLVSRKHFGDGFGFQAVADQIRKNDQRPVFQVAAAFTPDWQKIEGFALESGELAGEDDHLGQNTSLAYSGLLVIRDGNPSIMHLDDLADRGQFEAQAIHERWSVFQQVSLIIGGESSDDITMPGVYGRRILADVSTEDGPRTGLITFDRPMDNAETLIALSLLSGCGVRVVNAIHLDMGSVSEGYIYDESGTRHLLGADRDDIHKFTNLLVMTEAKIDG
jgi:hypothetical protein